MLHPLSNNLSEGIKIDPETIWPTFELWYTFYPRSIMDQVWWSKAFTFFTYKATEAQTTFPIVTYHRHPHRLGESVGGTALGGLRQGGVGQIEGGLITGIDDITQGQHGHPQPHCRSVHHRYHRLRKGDQSLGKIPENVSNCKCLKICIKCKHELTVLKQGNIVF